MPYRRYRRNYRHRRRSHAAGRIQSAWRRRKRRKFGLTARTALSNRRNINNLKKSIETIVSPPTQATSAGRWLGSWLQNLQVNQNGTDNASGLPFTLRPVYANNAVQNVGLMKGRWVQMKSLTIKGCVTAVSDPGASMYQRVTFILCHDNKPVLQPVLASSAATQNQGLLTPQLPAVANNRLDTAFYNLNTTGKEGRYKVLKRWHITVSPHVALNAYAVPAITTTAPVPPATYGVVSRPAYDAAQLALSKHYPPQVYFSHTIKGKYKFNFGSVLPVMPASVVKPVNQDLILFAFSTNGPGFTATAPFIQLASRFRFKDP